jgi:hypothetical protein
MKKEIFVKKKLLTILGIAIAVPLIMFFTLVLYFAFFDDDEEASTNDYSSSEINDTNKSDESNNNSENNQNDSSKDANANDETEKSELIIINDIDVTSKLQVKDVDSILYANAKSFIESFVSSDMSPGMRNFNYEPIEDRETMQILLSKFDDDGNEYIDEKYSHLIDKNAFLISSWFTDAALYILFIDSTDVVELNEESDKIITIAYAPKIINNEVYLPIEAITNMLGFEVQIEN